VNDYIEETFGANGHLARYLPMYAPRAQQIELTRAIDAAIADGENLLAEAPCGSGKGYAYLVPAIKRALESGASRMLVVTANIALQEQLFRKDLPTLREALPWPLEFALAKGRSNYICISNVDDTRADAVFGSAFDGEALAQWKHVEAWSRTTQEGDLSELPFELLPSLRQRVTTTSEDCLGRACESFGECFANRARERTEGAKVVVTNYHLFFADLAVRRASEDESSVLPPCDIVILDEGDKAASIAGSFYGFRVTAGSIRWAARLLAPTGTEAKKLPEIDARMKDRISRLADRFFAGLVEHRRSKEYRARLRRPDVVPWKELVAELKNAVGAYERVAENDALEKPERQKLRKAKARCEALAFDVARAMTCEDDDYVFFVEVDDKDRSALCARPIDVSELLRRDVFEVEETRSVIAVSATLTTGGSFDYVRKELGADGARELVVDSPFDIPNNMLVVVPAEAPDPRDQEFAEAVGDLLCRTIEEARGRTLGLFTSYKGLRAAAEAARKRHGRTYEILVQGTAPRMQLVQRFRENVSSVLLGTESFWTGVDVQGEALSCLFIDKIPFPSPDDPILDALDERESDAWRKYSLPRALIAFRQGIGRLLRTTTDRGVVVVCDPRIVEKGYGKLFLKACGGARVTRDLADVGTFLDRPDEWQWTRGTNEAPKTSARTSRGGRTAAR
jgi:ATP-dependent DNA helicase DinG